MIHALVNGDSRIGIRQTHKEVVARLYIRHFPFAKGNISNQQLAISLDLGLVKVRNNFF